MISQDRLASKIMNVSFKNYSCRVVTLLTAFFLLRITVSAQLAGGLDSSFNPTDVGFGFGNGANETVYTAFLQPDGKTIIGGDFTTYNDVELYRIARLNAD